MAIPLSRSQQKQRIREVNKLVSHLAALPPTTQAGLPIPAEVRDLLGECRRLKGGARKRQLKYITRLLRERPLEKLYQCVANEKGESLKKNRELHELEYIRDQLINEALRQSREARVPGEQLPENRSGEVLDDIVHQFPGIDRMDLARLASLYTATRKKKYHREIFRLLQSARQQQALAAVENDNEST